jgi:AcrR family transcriptional regulator
MTVVPTAVLTDPEADGRNLRRRHSYDAAVDAVLDLIGEGVPAPTAQQIADRSGISIRTVFRLTDDVESLHAAAVQRQTERIAPLYVDLSTEGALEARIASLVSNRATIFETIAPVRRVAERLALDSTRIADGLARHHRLLRAQVAALFEAELAQLTKERRVDALNAVDVVASWETWDQLRRRQSLSRREATRVVTQLLSGVLGPTGTRRP